MTHRRCLTEKAGTRSLSVARAVPTRGVCSWSAYVRVCSFAALPALLGLAGVTAPLAAADPPVMRELRIQQVGDVTYFHVQFATPKRMTPGSGAAGAARQSGQPRLPAHRRRRNQAVPPGTPPVREPKSATAPGEQAPAAARQPVPVDGIEFTGRLHGKGEVKFVLLYTTERRTPRLGRFQPTMLRGQPRPHWVETPVVLDFSKAEKTALPAEAKARRAARKRKPRRNNPRNGRFATISKVCGLSHRSTSSAVCKTR